MRTLTKETVIYAFKPDTSPVFSVNPGETFIVETDDCFRSQIQHADELVTDVDFSQINPATGPIEIAGVKAGDLLAVDILDIEVASQGVMVAIPEAGAFGDRITEAVTKIVPIQNGHFFFSEKLAFPIHPMIGVIGVAPAQASIPCGEIGDHGGNMDAKVITKNARIYFTAQVDGGMLALGDAHAGMGDGESVICGVETPATVTLKVERIVPKTYPPTRPIVELDGKYMTIGHGATLDEAAAVALDDMADMVQAFTGMRAAEAAMLISAVGDLRVCQIVDPQKTARVEMPKSALGLLPDAPIFA